MSETTTDLDALEREAQEKAYYDPIFSTRVIALVAEARRLAATVERYRQQRDRAYAELDWTVHD